MRFLARIRVGSVIHNTWRGHERLSGDIHGILFKRQGQQYVTDELDADQVKTLNDNPSDSIEIETLGTLPEPESPEQQPEEPAAETDQTPRRRRK